MSRISTKVNLAGLVHTRKMMQGQNGQVECLVIPIERNHLYVGEKGIYLDLIGFELKSPQTNEKGNKSATHIVRQSFPKDVQDAMTDEQKQNIPLIGSHNLIEFSESEIGSAEVAPVQSEEDDLPF